MKKDSEIFSVFVCFLCFLYLSCGPLLGQEKVSIWKNPPEKVKVNDHFSFIFQQDVSSKLTVVHILVKGGKRGVPLSQRGLAFLTTRLVVEMQTSDNFRRLMQLGSSIFYHVEGDFATISIRSLTENLEETLKIITGNIRKPLFSGLRITNVKQYLEHRQKSEEDSPEQLMELTFFNAFSSTYGGSIFGDADSLENFKRKDIVDFYNRFYNYANMIISVSTDLAKAEMTPIMAKYFDSFPPGEPYQFEPVQASVPEKKEIFLEKDNQQVLISFGALLPGMSRKNFVMIYMLENLLGKGIGSKLWPLRAKKKLAYSLKTRFFQLEGAGLLTVFLKTDTTKRAEAHKALKELIINLYNSGITLEELNIARVLSRAEFLRDNETKENRTQLLAYFEALGVGFDFLEEFFSQVDQVTVEDFNAYLKRVLNPAQLFEVVIGPGEEVSTKAGRTGSKIKNLLPFPAWDSTQTLP